MINRQQENVGDITGGANGATTGELDESARGALFEEAAAILRQNDRGDYTVPTHGLYPFQWNWDSCLVALGQRHIDEARAWREIETLFAHQWDDGMVPHIVFHERDEGYFPGPDVWATGRAVPTSGITQPPVAGFAARRLFLQARNKALARERAAELLAGIDRWHEWFYRCRDPEGTGLVALIHPWESGRDNSIDWDDGLAAVPTDGVEPYQRRDTSHADASHRPTQAQYDRYVSLLQHFRSLGWDNAMLHDASPFRIVDPGFNAILVRSCADLADLADALGDADIAAANRERAARGLAALESLWSEPHGQYVCFDRAADKPVDSASIGGLIPAFAAIPSARLSALAARLDVLAANSGFLVPSHDPLDSRYDAKRYWRGPVWLIVNYLIADGLRAGGEQAAARRIEQASIGLIGRGGFAEYYDPGTGEPCGGGSFTWTAAMVMEILRADTASA